MTPSVWAYAAGGTIPYLRTQRLPSVEAFQRLLGPGGRWDKIERAWHVPLSDAPSVVATLRGAGFAVTEHESFTGALSKAKIAKATAVAQALGRSAHLYPFQREGARWLAERSAGLLADEMGLGKTIQVLAAHPSNAPLLVVCPAIAIGTWEREIRRWRPDLIPKRLTKAGFAIPPPPYAGLVSYDSLPFDASTLKGTTLVADEAHAVKSSRARRTRSFRLLASRILLGGGRVWLLTGTPLENRPPELWHLLTSAHLATRAFGSWEHFRDLFGGTPVGAMGEWLPRAELRCDGTTHRPFCAATELLGPLAPCGNCKPCKAWLRGKGERAFVEMDGGTQGSRGTAWGIGSREVRESLGAVMLRRHRKDVLPELPDKSYADLDAELDENTLEACAAVTMRDGETAAELYARLSKPAEFAAISGLMERLATAKIPALLAHVADFEEAEEPLVVFSPYRRPIETLGKRPGWVSILGDDTPEERAMKVADFQAGLYKGIAGTAGAMGTSVTLTRASKTIFCGRPWNPEKGRQCEDRVCRIGQDRGVTIYNLVSEHALDRRLNDVLTAKDAIIESVLGVRK